MSSTLISAKNLTNLVRQWSDVEVGSTAIDSVEKAGQYDTGAALGTWGKVTLNLRGALGVRVINGPEDLEGDTDGVVGVPDEPAAGGAEDDAAPALPPQLELRADGPPWIKYRAEAGLRAGLADIGGLPFRLSAGATLVLFDYRAHDRSEALHQALTDDLVAGPRVVLRMDDVLGLRVGDALGMRVQGQLEASATLTWGDVLTSQLGSILDATGVRRAIPVHVTSGLTVTGSASIQDEFVVGFSRIDEHAWRVAVLKARNRSLGAGVRAGVSVRVDPTSVTALVGSYLEAVLGGPLAQIQAQLARLDPDRLDEGQRALLDRLLATFGLTDAPEAIARLRARLDRLPSEASAAVEKAAKTRLEIGFAFDYARLSESRAILQARLTSGHLKTHHAHLIAGRLGPVAASLDLESFLDERSTTRRKAWGFSLGLGKWRLRGRDSSQLQKVERRDAGGHVQRAYLGTRSYHGLWVNREWSWDVDFDARMPGFSLRPETPCVSEFEVGLALVWRHRLTHLGANDIEELLDAAALWRIVREDDLSPLRAKLAEARGEPCEATIHLTVGPGELWTIEDALADPPSGALAMANALGAAMPWWDKRPLPPSQRRTLYGPLWALHLTQPDLSYLELRRIAAERLRRHPHPEAATLAAQEEASGSRTHTFSGLVDLNRDTPERYTTFTRGMQSLRAARAAAEPDHDRLPKIFKSLSALWTQSHHVRALGVSLLDAAKAKGIEAKVSRALHVEVPGKPTLVVAGGR